MTINLHTLEKKVTTLAIGLGWDMADGQTQEFDLDVSAFMLTKSGHIPTPEHVVFYHNPRAPDGSLFHHGDNRDGEGEGDDETLEVKLEIINRNIDAIAIIATVYNDNKATEKNHLGMVKNAFIRIYNSDTKEELYRYDFTSCHAERHGLEFGRLFRKKGNWLFKAEPKEVDGGMNEFIDMYA